MTADLVWFRAGVINKVSLALECISRAEGRQISAGLSEAITSWQLAWWENRWELISESMLQEISSAPQVSSDPCCFCLAFINRFSPEASHLLCSFANLAPAGELSSFRKSAMNELNESLLTPMGRSLLDPASSVAC